MLKPLTPVKQNKSKQTEHASVPSPPRVNNIPRRVVMVRYAWHGSLAYHAWRAICFCKVTGACDCFFANVDRVQTTSKKIFDASHNILGCLIVNGSDAEKLTTSSGHEPPRFLVQILIFLNVQAESFQHWDLGIRQTLNSLFRL